MKQTAFDFSTSSLCYFPPNSSISFIFYHRRDFYRGLPVLPPRVVPLPSNIVVHHTSVLSTPIHVPLYWLPLVLNNKESPLFVEGFRVFVVGLAAKKNQVILSSRWIGVTEGSMVTTARHLRIFE
ncbi:hypothetical protein V6Z11_A09G093000 [Gossypium hirsutum]